MDFFNRLLNHNPHVRVQLPDPLHAEDIDTGYRLFWTKTALGWDAARRAELAARVDAAINAPDFEANALERRFRVEGLDDQAHSGASLLALRAVLRALDEYDAAE